MKRLMLYAALLLVLVFAGCQSQTTTTDNSSTDISNQEGETEQDNEDEVTEDQQSEDTDDQSEDSEQTESADMHQEEADDVVGTIEAPVTVDNPDSIEVVVNKTRKLPDGWEPEDLVEPNVPFYFDEHLEKRQMRQEAADALEDLFAAAESEGIELLAASGYRSYERQEVIYENNVAAKGQEETDKVSARPGTSEHQTGLAIDLTSAEMAFALEETFAETNEGAWLKENAHKFGYIIRYPEGKTDITGYSYEPWHIRYVGKDIAEEIYKQNETLEEYFNMKSDLS